MNRSLECFNTEWCVRVRLRISEFFFSAWSRSHTTQYGRYELQAKGKLPKELAEPVPDIYIRNQELDEQVRMLRGQVRRCACVLLVL